MSNPLDYICAIVTSALNVILHSFGAYLLIELYKRGPKRIQQLFLINLSLVECIYNVNILLISSTGYISVRYNSSMFDEAKENIWVINLSGMFYLLYISMILITFDRFIAVKLNMQYAIRWDETKTKRLIILIWSLSIITCTIMLGIYKIIKEKEKDIFFAILQLYIPAIFDLIFTVTAIVSYLNLFYKFVNSKRNMLRKRRHDKKESLFHIFRKSKFYTVFLLVISFIIFTTIPGLINAGYGLAGHPIPKVWDHYTTISFNMSSTIDAVIYIFMQKPVRRILLKKCRYYRASTRRYPSKLLRVEEIELSRKSFVDGSFRRYSPSFCNLENSLY